MKARVGKWFDSLTLRSQLVILFLGWATAVACNLVFAWIVYLTFRDLYPHSSGWTAFGMWWLVLIASSTIIGNIGRLTVKAFGAFRAHRSRSLADNFRDAAHRAMRRARG